LDDQAWEWQGYDLWRSDIFKDEKNTYFREETTHHAGEDGMKTGSGTFSFWFSAV